MKKLVILMFLGISLISAGAAKWSGTKNEEKSNKKNTKIQLALLLDTSNSMDGLIEQAKAKLWSIVNEMADNEINGEALDIEIALYDYGNDRISMLNHYVRQQVSFTSDVDEISEKLFALTTKGGQEYCGAAIQKSLQELEWADEATYKVLFIAGNESFAQGPIRYESVIEDAREKDVVVNTIFCGNAKQGKQLQWKNGADQGAGEFFVINQNEAVTYIETPQDKQIEHLNQKLNETYVPYGENGEKKYNKLKDQDKNASKYGASNMASRAIFKSKKQYNNATWDLVDAYDKSNKIINETDKLPEAFKQLSVEERQEKILKMKANRKRIKDEIHELSLERKRQIKSKEVKGKTDDLGESMSKSLQKQMNKKGISKVKPDDASAVVDYPEFEVMTEEVKAYRADRLISVAEFNRMSKDKSTVVLDTRSKWAYDGRHIKGAFHLNFSDFTAEKLAKLIPDKNTRILIYCNNNFFGDPKRMALKSAPLALNIPTFINLYGYGYKNVYELKSQVSVDDKRMQFEGSGVGNTAARSQIK